MISVQTEIELEGDLNIANLSRKLDEINLPKEILQTSLTKLQNNLIQELCQTTPYQRQTNITKEPAPPKEP
ncbi:MAG: hypothetical protein LBH62_00245 [Nitrososphaerota archaeon]|jgi:hypothetical protein|nr:hypothetical protein [Nitrososphaerota archaeon]